MVKKILTILNKEFSSIHQAAFLLGFFALFSQVLGLLRDRLLASHIGLSSNLDIYYAAFRIPDFIYVSVACLVSITALMPFLTEKMKGDGDHAEAHRFLNDMFTVFLYAMIAISVILYIIMPYIAKSITPGFSPEATLLTIKISRLMLLSPIFLGLSNLFGSVTQFYRRFFLYSLSPVLYNVGIILGIFLFYPSMGVVGLAWGVALGAMLHMFVQLVVMVKYKFVPKISKVINWNEVLRVLAISLPRTAGLAFNNMAIIIIIAFASLVGEGAISVFKLSSNLQAVPLAIIGVSYAVATFSNLTKYISENQRDKFIDQVTLSARQVIFWSMPVTVLFIVLRAQIVRVILGSGHFTWQDTRLVAASLAIFALSVVAQSMILLFARAYYAAGNTRKPLIMNFICSFGIVILAYVLVHFFNQLAPLKNLIETLLRVQGIPGTAVLMLPLAYSIGTIVNFILHWVHFKKDFENNQPFLRTAFFQSIFASIVIGMVTYIALGPLAKIFDLDKFIDFLLQGLIAGIIGIIAGGIVLSLMKNKEMLMIQETFKTKFWKTSPISATGEGI